MKIIDLSSLEIRELDGDVSLGLRIQPRAGRNRLVGIHDGCLKISITAAPVDDAANRECLKFLSDIMAIPLSRIKIISGEHARSKAVRLSGMNGDECRKRIGLFVDSLV